jgi:hypothetical protein
VDSVPLLFLTGQVRREIIADYSVMRKAPRATTTIVLILFFSGIQLFFLGLLGEYIGAIYGQVMRKPFVIVREKINFQD